MNRPVRLICAIALILSCAPVDTALPADDRVRPDKKKNDPRPSPSSIIGGSGYLERMEENITDDPMEFDKEAVSPDGQVVATEKSQQS
jgi:hypothetical protein